MSNLSLLLIVALFAIVWIEFYPKRLDSVVYFLLYGCALLCVLLVGLFWLPAPAGWALTVLGIVGLYWNWRRFGRKVNWTPLEAFVSSVWRAVSRQAARARKVRGEYVARRATGQHESLPESAPSRWRLILIALVLVISSPFAAALLSAVLSAVLTAIEFVTQGSGMEAIVQSGPLQFTLGQAYVVLFSSLHVLATKPLLGVSLLLSTALIGAAVVLRTGYTPRRMVLAVVAVGAVYPALYVVADLSGWLGTGMFN